MDATTLEKLKGEAAEALSRALNTIGSDAALASASIAEVLKTLDRMKAEATTACVRGCVAKAHAAGECVVSLRFTDAEPATFAKARPEPIVSPPTGSNTQAWLSSRAAEDAKLCGVNSVTRGQALGGEIGTYAMPKSDGVCAVNPPRPPKPCPTLGCTFVNGHNAPCNGKPSCPHDNVGCGVTRVCEVCKDNTQRANVPSGKAMLLDGPAPTPAQVAHIRKAVLTDVSETLGRLHMGWCARFVERLDDEERPPVDTLGAAYSTLHDILGHVRMLPIHNKGAALTHAADVLFQACEAVYKLTTRPK